MPEPLIEPTQQTDDQANSDRAELAQIDDLKRGYTTFFEQLAGLATSSQKVLISNVFTPEIRTALQEHRSDLDAALARFSNMCKEMPVALMEDTLEKSANREFHNYFTQQFSPHRLSFIATVKEYQTLKSFQLECEELLNQIQGIVTAAEVPKDSEFYGQLLSYRIVPALRMVEAVRIFCGRLSILVGMREEPSSLKALSQHVLYLPDLDYQFSTVFTANLRAVIENAIKDAEAERPPAPPEPPQKKSRPTAQTATEEEHVLNTAGGAAWNRGSHYFFSYDPERLEQERAAFTTVIYIDTHMGADSQVIKSNIIRNIARKEAGEAGASIEERYTAFLKTYFDLVVDISMLNLGIRAEHKLPFLYHIGPATFFHLTRRFLQEANTGTFHTKVGKSMIKKYIPLELLRKTVLDWYRERIVPETLATRDDPAIYQNLLKPIRAAHRDLSARAVEKYEALPEPVRRSKTRNDLFREHMNDWFGATNIIIFKRFLKE